MGISKAKQAEKIRKQKAAEKQAYNNEYNKGHYLNYSFRLNKETELYIAKHIAEQPEGLKAYIIGLIVKDIKNQRRRMKVSSNGEAVS